MSSTGDTRRAGAVGVAATAVVVSPLLTTSLPFQRALIAQAALVLGITLVLLALGLLRRGWRDRVAASKPVLLGVALYAAAALQGTVVALVRGNDLKLAAGQLLAMGLLPLAAVAALGVSTTLSWRAFATGLASAVAAGTLIQGVVAGPATVANPGNRLMLPNAVSVAGAAAMALFFALALTRSGRTFARALAWAAAALTAALIFASAIRSQWLVLPLGLACLFAFALGLRTLFSRRIALAWGAALVVVVGAAAATAWWWTRPRPNLASGTLDTTTGAGDAASSVRLLGGTVRVRGSLTCGRGGIVYLRVRGTGEASAIAPDSVVQLFVAGAAPSDFWIVHRPLPAESTLQIHLEDPSNLGCRTTVLAVEAIAPGQLVEVVWRLARMLHRLPDPSAGSTPVFAAHDGSIAFRIREAHAVLAAIRQAPWPSWAFGQGLGAIFASNTFGYYDYYDTDGHIVHVERPNYIHNFYLFLLFKLGALGGLAVVTALALWVLTAVRGAREKPAGSADRWFLAAAAASWVTYLAWSVAAPEILDFRLAPVWGLLVATTATTMERPGASGETEPLPVSQGPGPTR